MKMMRKSAIIVCTALALSACTALRPPAPQLPSRANVVAGEHITVSGNQNIYAVAKANKVSMRDLIVLNNLQPPFALKPGQMLVLPAGASGVTSYDNAPAVLSAPATGVTSSALSTSPVSSSALPQPGLNDAVESQPLSPIVPAPVTKAAPLKTTQVDVLNKPSPPPKTVTTTVMTNTPQPAKPEIPPAPLQKAPSPAPVTSAPPEPSKVVELKSAQNPDANAEAPHFVWPVQGPILSTFGSKGQGLNNDGINIGAPKGSPVVAAAGGMVVYAGNEMKGFGNLVLIRHAGGWVTAYAHLDRILVSKDSVVAAGDMIATVGKTGNVPSSQLHFEIRHNGKSADPSGLISKP